MLKGGLHCHTTRSDGDGTPEEVIRLHKENNYDFIAFYNETSDVQTMASPFTLEDIPAFIEFTTLIFALVPSSQL